MICKISNKFNKGIFLFNYKLKVMKIYGWL